MVYFVYILKSCKDQKLYIGFSRDVKKRLKAHNALKVFSTKHRAPFELIYFEEVPSLKEAVQKERYFKNLHRDRLMRLINSVNGGCSAAG